MSLGREAPAAVRMVVAAILGVAVGVAVGITDVRYAPVAGWISTAAVYLLWTWAVIGPMSAADTASHATNEDSTRAATDLILLAASVASLGGVAYLLMAGKANGTDAEIAAAVGVTSVAAAWLVAHTVFTLRYAKLYYLPPAGGVSFNQDDPPSYADFAYLAFTIGMTYQVSDTDLQTRAVRTTALRHALLSFLLGAIVLASTINLVAGLGSSS